MESAQFELHFQNVGCETNKLYVVEAVGTITGEVVRMSGEAVETIEAVETPVAFEARETVETPSEAPISSGFTVGTPGGAVESLGAVKTRETSVSLLTDVSHLVKVLNRTLKNDGRRDIVFYYLHAKNRIQVTVPGGKTLQLKKDSPSLILGLGEIAAGKSWVLRRGRG